MRTAPRAVSTNGSCSSFYPATVLLRSLASSVFPLIVRPRKVVTKTSRQHTKYAKQRTSRHLHPDCVPKQERFRHKVVHFFQKLLCFRRKAVEFFFAFGLSPIRTLHHRVHLSSFCTEKSEHADASRARSEEKTQPENDFSGRKFAHSNFLRNLRSKIKVDLAIPGHKYRQKVKE